MSKKPVVLMVLDGYGISDKTEGNAIALANTPVTTVQSMTPGHEL